MKTRRSRYSVTGNDYFTSLLKIFGPILRFVSLPNLTVGVMFFV